MRAPGRTFLLLFALSFSSVVEAAIPLDGHEVIGIAPAKDGSVWFTTAKNEVGIVRPNGAIETVKMPPPFENRERAAMVALEEGSVWVGSRNYVLAHVDASLRVTLRNRSLGAYGFDPNAPTQLATGSIADMTRGPDGNVWYVPIDTRFVLGTFSREGWRREYHLPMPPRVVATGPDGWLWVSGRGSFFRVSTEGKVESMLISSCDPCEDIVWMVATADWTIWTNVGHTRPGRPFERFDYGGTDAKLGPDGKVWIAGPHNTIRVIEGERAVRELPLREPKDVPTAIGANDSAVWYALGESIERLDPNRIDPQLRAGDLIVHEQVADCCGAGAYPLLAWHRAGGERFAWRMVENPELVVPSSAVYALDRGGVLVDRSRTPAPTVFFPRFYPKTDVPRSITSPWETVPGGIAVDAADTIYSVQSAPGNSGGCGLITSTIDGKVSRRSSCPIEGHPVVTSIDLAADQCTIFFTGYPRNDPTGQYGMIGRFDACRSKPLPAFIYALPARAHDIRILRNGDVLVAFPTALVRYNQYGAIIRQFRVDATALALDRNTRYAWVGTPSSELLRVDLETGDVVERLGTYGIPVSISVVGEPRAATPMRPRRQTVRH